MEENSFDCHRVMIVDDARIDRFLAEKIISRHAFAEEVVSVDSALGALEYLTKNSANDEALPDLIFLDINMPEMNGFEFLASYKTMPERIRSKCIIIMLSSSLDPEDKELALQSPYVRHFLNKPLTKQKLQEVTPVRGQI
ncbi:response regulator [Dyadobacter sp. CY326]|uniref:response regulator n=1 Tax=Dyadobacter sp. CY326 TaxID=2907300 RepID=UPI001F4020AC|nr:response regulator [Dyadobacter sp. CY326]MCE7065108.1 response regulator [Dyadobacter sp. CY326]